MYVNLYFFTSLVHILGSSTIAAESLSLSAVEASADASKANNPAPMMRTIARLWCSECTCVFGDGIIAEEGNKCYLDIYP